MVCELLITIPEEANILLKPGGHLLRGNKTVFAGYIKWDLFSIVKVGRVKKLKRTQAFDHTVLIILNASANT